jgi:hypothetical protein
MDKRLKYRRRKNSRTSGTQVSLEDQGQILNTEVAPTSRVKIVGNTVHVVVSALENPKFKWRTIDGVAKEAGVDPLTVQRVFKKLGEEVVRANAPSTSGDELFTTRRHLREKESFFNRVGAVLRNRAS